VELAPKNHQPMQKPKTLGQLGEETAQLEYKNGILKLSRPTNTIKKAKDWAR